MSKPQIRVLIVDDDTVDRLACRRVIARDPDYEFVLLEAATGREGLQLAEAHQPDCILLDYHLPDLNGLEFLAELAGGGEISVPVMLLTGADSAAVAASAIKQGARDYLGKDVDGQYLELLPAAIQRMLREQELAKGKHKAEAELRLLAAHLENIKEAERKRIAQEIHDELGGLLTGIKAYVSVYLERSARSGAAPDPLLVEVASLADAGFQAVRRVITDLRPSVLDQLGVWAALEWHAGQIEKRSGLPCTCAIDADAAAIEVAPELSTMIFRVVQEALTNAVRHAEATRIAVEVALEGDVLRVEVRDNGKGIASAREPKRESWGIIGMHERTRYFGGELRIEGKAGQGTVVTLRMPLEKTNVR